MDDPSSVASSERPANRLRLLRFELKKRRPRLLTALAEDALAFSVHRGEQPRFDSKVRKWLTVIRLAFVADDYLGVMLYRVRTSLYDAGVPVLPRMLHLVCTTLFGIRIGEYVAIAGGLYVPHGQVVIDGMVLVGPRCFLAPWTTIGVQSGDFHGPVLEGNVFVGSGAKIIGGVTIGERARIGANAVVTEDVPAGATAVGVPAKVIAPAPEAPSVGG